MIEKVHLPASRAGRPRLRTRAAWLLAAGAIAFFPVAVGLVSPHDLEMHDQAKQAMYILDALEGHWLVPRARGAVSTKPPLYTWVGAAGAKLLGLSEFTVRLPSILATLGLGVVMFSLGRRLVGRHAALLAVALLAVLQHTTKLAFFARPDMLLAFWVALALAAFLRGWNLTFWTAIGMATLTKGPPGFALPLLSVALLAGLRSDSGVLRGLRPLRGTAIVVAIVAVWLVPAWLQHGEEIGQVVREELLDRVTGRGSRLSAKHHPFWYLLPYFFAKLLPWSILIPFALAGGRGRMRSRLFLAAWILAGFAVFALPASKRTDYLLPFYPPAALLAAAFLMEWVRGTLALRATRLLTLGTRLWAAALGAAALLVAPAAQVGLLPTPSRPSLWAFALGLAGLVPLASAFRARASPPARLAMALGAQALVALLYSQLLSAPARQPDAPAVRRFAQEVGHRSGGGEVEFYRARASSLQFLLRRNRPELKRAELKQRAARGEPTWVVLSGSAYADLASDPISFQRLGAPPVLARSAPRRQCAGDPLVLIRLGGRPAS